MSIKQYEELQFTPPIRELYVQTQNWARHNENLIIATNAVIFSGIAAIFTSIIKSHLNGWHLLLLPAISIFGICLTHVLNRRYMLSIRRLVAYEKLFGFHKPLRNPIVLTALNGETAAIDYVSDKQSIDQVALCKWGRCLVPDYLHEPPKYGPESVKIFQTLHVLMLLMVAAIAVFYFLR